MKKKDISEYMASLGKKGGRSKSPEKLRAIMENLKEAYKVPHWRKRKKNEKSSI